MPNYYKDEIDMVLRFGDVLEGFANVEPVINNPIEAAELLGTLFHVEVGIPKHVAILTPCCSIRDKVISLAPLVSVKSSYFTNEHIAEDLTKINRLIDPQETVPSDVWDMLGEEEREKRLAVGRTYAWNNIFIYQDNDVFTEDVLHVKDKDNIKTKYKMIDFKSIYKVKCDKIITPKDSQIIENKRLQLTDKARGELRNKISWYFTRVPEEEIGEKAI